MMATRDIENVSPECGNASAGSLHVKPALWLGKMPTSSRMVTAATVQQNKNCINKLLLKVESTVDKSYDWIMDIVNKLWKSIFLYINNFRHLRKTAILRYYLILHIQKRYHILKYWLVVFLTTFISGVIWKGIWI